MFRFALFNEFTVLHHDNVMRETIYKMEMGKNTDILLNFGNVLLALRKEIGVKTQLNNKDMLRWLIKDI